MTFTPSWISLGSCAVVTAPKLLFVKVLLTSLNCVWLKVLKVSARSSRRLPRDSLNTKLLKSAMFQFCRPGPYTELRGILPNSPARVGEKADLSNQLFTVCGVLTLPFTFGRLFELGRTLVMLAVPISEPVHADGAGTAAQLVMPPSVILIGLPDAKLTTPDTCHPPTVAFSKVLELFFKNGMS